MTSPGPGHRQVLLLRRDATRRHLRPRSRPRHAASAAAHRHALLLGIRHGAFRVGCCWALMLLMFVLGTGNVGMMLALGAVMAAEKNLSWGRRLGAPLGAALIGWAVIIVIAKAGGA